MRTVPIPAVLLLLLVALRAVAAEGPAPVAEPLRLPLWSAGAPDGKGGIDAAGKPSITVHRAAKPNGTAVVICPGGGYGGLVTGAEGHGIARWLNEAGITGVVLEYRLPAGRSEVPLLDAQQAIRLTRDHASDWKVRTDRVGIMGFSAGGHLAATATTHFDGGAADAKDPVARQGSRPDFAILVYPVITMGPQTHGGSRQNLLGSNPSAELVKRFSCEEQVTTATPPVFLAHAIDDHAVTIENSRIFAAALKAKGVTHRLLELPNGDHGLNGYKGPSWDAWQRESLQWIGQLPARK
jgi:acetyl esterase/lipase